MTRLRRFFALEAGHRQVLVLSLLLLPATAALLRWPGYAAARSFLVRLPVAAGDAVLPEDAARMVNAAAAFVGASCLPRSLVLWRVLLARGATIRFGAALPAAQSLAAHAWVEIDGRPLDDAPPAFAAYALLSPNSASSGMARRAR